MDGLQWWCAAVDLPWTWQWRPYPGVWIFLAILAAGYWRMRRMAPSPPPHERLRRRAAATGAIVTLWLALDWPIGALGGGYLASAHMLQYLLIAFVAPTLLVVGLPRGTSEAIAESRVGPAVRALTHPVVAVLLYVAALVTTHTPTVTDGFMANQLGAFAIDMLWLVPAIPFWWNIVGFPPGRKPLSPPQKIGTIVLGSLGHTPIGMWLMMSSHPVYATYELAPPIPGLAPLMDQHLAAAFMLMLGWAYILGAISVTFFRWQGMGAEREAAAGDP